MPDLASELQSAQTYVNERYGPPNAKWHAEARNNDLWPNAFTDTTKHAHEHRAVVFVRSSDDEDTRRFDFTHESVHLLNPVPTCKMSCLEEGAAVVISMERTDYNSGVFVDQQLSKLRQPDQVGYLEAYLALKCLIKRYPDGLIRTLRGVQGRSLSTDICAIDITNLVPGTDKIAQRLCSKFY
ncbi:MAG TPA: hypothetical protein VH206_17490 [Xanthobacteraceae bacterium]|jgi:hypothetical protein|nr:hypothetical protein [Xanthobacteraceae bacterium]